MLLQSCNAAPLHAADAHMLQTARPGESIRYTQVYCSSYSRGTLYPLYRTQDLTPRVTL